MAGCDSLNATERTSFECSAKSDGKGVTAQSVAYLG